MNAENLRAATPNIRDVDILDGVKVVEVTTAVSAPLIGRVLAELGAEVVKVESRAKVDVNRARVPRPTDPDGFPSHEAFQLLHEASASKQSVTLNMKTDRGKELFLELLADADVFIENFVPGWLDRLGLPIDYLRARFPRLVILSASGYGQTGPMRTQRSYAPVMTALAGIEGLIGYADGQVMGCSALALADLNCTFNGVFLVMAALAGREATGAGTHLDLSQIEAAATLAGEAFVEEQLQGARPGPRGNQDPDGTRWSVRRTVEDDTWVAARVVEPEPDSTPRPTREELLKRLRAKGIESACVASPQQVIADPRFRGRGYTQDIEHPHPAVGELTITSVPWRVEGAVPRVRRAAPMIGAGNTEILGRYADAAELAELEDQGVLK
ncbi:CaiB/BaiF CoA transferase family protein [Nocardia jinanensis]|uniref:CoA transferase n=1 Tax=Nocardia jinanensis TaxID=382504 RepID=A0A917RJW0_9NOCA|nr:CoA transferase [Nocardia jinanensis]GGL11918.1 CoA transferase [Nocardia jinanensis]